MAATSSNPRRFGLAFGSALILLGGLFLWRDVGAAPYLLGVGGLVVAIAIVLPRLLRPVEAVFTAVGKVVSAALTYGVLAIVFFVVVTPLGLVMRLLRRDPLTRKPDPDIDSYWVPVPPDGPASRPDRPF